MNIFYSPLFFLCFLILPILLILLHKMKLRSSLRFSSLRNLGDCYVSWRIKFYPILLVLRFLCLALLIVALARPRKGLSVSNVSINGVAINLVLDRSGSMQEAMRYDGQKTTRLEVAKAVIADFIKGDNKKLKGRDNDYIGLISFAKYPDTTCPLVENHGVLLDFLRQIKPAEIKSENATAIGEALALACARLHNAEMQILENNKKLNVESQNKVKPDFTIKSKVVILLTDGVNNAGDISPLEAAKMAKKWGIKVYTIGLGAVAPNTFFGFAQSSGLDERLLERIAAETGGFYQRAVDADSLRDIYEKIDKLEKTEIKSVEHFNYSEKFPPWAIAALWVLGIEMVLANTLLRKN